MIESPGSCNWVCMRTRGLVVAALVAVVGCGGEQPEDELGEAEETGEGTPLICDGSQDLRLAWAMDGGGQVHTEMQRELGFAYLYVRGDCRYWVLPHQGPPTIEVAETRTGVLDEDQAAELAEMLDYANFETLAEAEWPQAGGEDGPTVFAHDGEHMIACADTCVGAPAGVETMTTAGSEYFLELWEAGEPLVGAPMRIQARFLGGLPVDSVPVWEGGVDLSAVDTSPDDLLVPGTSVLVEDSELTSQLRAFRAQHPEDSANFAPIVVNDQGGAYEVFVRDAIPLEDAQGLIPKP